MSEQESTASEPRESGRPLGRFLLSAALLAALVWGAVTAGGQVRSALHTVAGADAELLGFAGMCETLSYVLLAMILRRLAGDARLSFGDAFRVGLVSAGLGAVLPAAPIEGMVLSARELQVRGVNRRRTFVAVGLGQWYFARALFGVAALAAVVVASFAALRNSPFGDIWPLMLLASVGLALIFALMGWLVRRAHLLESLGRRAQRLRVGRERVERLLVSCRAWSGEVRHATSGRTNRIRLLACAAGASAADAACFVFALRAAGVRAASTVLVLAYAIAMFATFVPLLPAGLGAVETAVPAFLHHDHVAITAALAGVLAYRALATLAPAFIGAISLGELRLRRRNPSHTDEAAT